MRSIYKLIITILLLPIASVYAQSPVEFIENQGQWGDWFHYKAETRGGDILLENDGFRYILADATNNVRLDSFHHGQLKENPILKFHCYKVTFQGAKHPVIYGEKPQKTYYNYFLGDDPKRWKSNIHPNYAVNYHELYNDIDLHISSEKGALEYEFIVKPGADASQVRLNFTGQDAMEMDNGDLIIHTSVGPVKEVKPYAYQYINDERKEVPCQYVLNQNVLSFQFPNGYDKSSLLVIDPVVVFSTLTGSTADNWGFTATYDNNGNFYAGGLVNCLALGSGGYGGTFPVSTGAFQTTWGGGYSNSTYTAYAADISIIKYNPTGTTRLFATYLGGAGNEHAHSMIVDGNGDLLLAGRTISQNYPVTSGAYQTSNRGGWDMIVSKMNSTGTSLVASTYIGGTGDDCVNFDSTEYTYGQLKYNYGDESRSEIQVDNTGNVYVTGCTFSSNFPTTSAALSSSISGAQDGVVFKMNSGLTSLIWGTYLGGSSSDAGYVLAFDSAQQYLYVAGGTNSSNFPVLTGAWRGSYGGGGADGFICKFQNSGSYTLQKSTYVGTTGYDQVYGIQVDPSDNVYVMGQSIGGLFPVTSGVYSDPNSSQFIMKIDKNLATDLISTVFGSRSPTQTNISPVAFLVDTCENVYVSGWGGNLGISGVASGSCSGMYVTSDASQSTTDGSDFYFIVFAPGMTSVRYASYFGRSCSFAGYGEHVDGGTSRFDRHGVIYQAICASCGGATIAGCTAYPTTTGAWATADASPNCNEGALKISFDLGPVVVKILAGPSTNGCSPLTVNFTNNTTNGASFLWDFGDGSPLDTSFNPGSHTYTTPGVHTVIVKAHNNNACFVTDDSVHLTIVVDTNRIKPDFTFVIKDSCGPYSANFTNTSVYGATPGATSFTKFIWNFGDGTTYTGANPPLHIFPDSGIYTIKLVMIDSTSCNSPDSISKTITLLNYKVSGSFTIPDSICVGTAFTPTVIQHYATGYLWSFGNGVTSSTSLPSIRYDSAGTYTVTFILLNPGTCNGADTFRRVITVMGGPIAAFTYSPATPETNIPISYLNRSIDATRYSWDFGDGTTSAEVNPVHQFNKTGTYRTCLTAYNNSNCPSIACKDVETEIVPIIGLPTGFSPNGDNQNDILYVRGAAIKTLDLKIYNRWGQLIFETTSKEIGWDGTFNGQPQPIDAYGYVLLATFIDGSNKTMKGNITLLR